MAKRNESGEPKRARKRPEPRKRPVATVPIPLPVATLSGTADDIDSRIADALRDAGANGLSDGRRAWLWDRVGRFGLDSRTINLGGLRRSGPGECRGDARPLASFLTLGEAATALVDTASRVGATAEDPAPDVAEIGDLDERGEWHAYWKWGPFSDARGRHREGWHRHPASSEPGVYRHDQTPPAPLDVGWILFLGPSDEAKEKYAAIRADWASFEPQVTTNPKLAFLKPDLEEWKKFSSAWEFSDWTPTFQHPDLGEPSELGSRLNAEIIRANRVRAELASFAAQKHIAPQDMPEARRGISDPATDSTMGRFAKRIDDWARSNSVIDWITKPNQTPQETAGKTIGIMAAVAIAGAAIVSLVRSARPVIVNVRSGK